MSRSIKISFLCYECRKATIEVIADLADGAKDTKYPYCKNCKVVHRVYYSHPTICIDPTEEQLT